MYPTLFTIGKWSVPTYTVLLDLGLILGVLLTYLEGRRQLKDGALALDLALWAVIGGIVGGRIGYVLVNWSVFSEDWVRALRIWEGGLSFHSAFLGGLLVMVLFAGLQRGENRVPFWALADVAAPGLALAIAFGWAACLMGGCAYGALGEGFGYAVLPDLYGVEASRFATQAVGIAFALVLFLGLWLMRGRWPFSGAAFLMFNLLYFAGQFFLEFTRGDEAVYLGPWRLAQILNLALALAAAVALLVLWWQTGKAADQETVAEETEEPQDTDEVGGAKDEAEEAGPSEGTGENDEPDSEL
jgi:phosphatidylglycerol:prolipoprotein diacylglycerol transferase